MALKLFGRKSAQKIVSLDKSNHKIEKLVFRPIEDIDWASEDLQSRYLSFVQKFSDTQKCVEEMGWELEDQLTLIWHELLKIEFENFLVANNLKASEIDKNDKTGRRGNDEIFFDDSNLNSARSQLLPKYDYWHIYGGNGFLYRNPPVSLRTIIDSKTLELMKAVAKHNSPNIESYIVEDRSSGVLYLLVYVIPIKQWFRILK